MSNATDPETEALRPVIYELGVAVYVCQLFENSLLFLVSILSAHKGVVTADSFKEALGDHSEKTLGLLAKAFRSKLRIPDNYEVFVREGVEARNRVVHGFVRRNSDKLLTVQGRAELVDELRELQHIVNDRITAVNEVLDRALQVFGGSLEQLRKDAEFPFEPDDIDSITQH